MTLIENYLRLDQEYRLAYAEQLLDNAELDPDLRKAQAELDVEEIIRERLEALILLENQREEREELNASTMDAVREGWERANGTY